MATPNNQQHNVTKTGNSNWTNTVGKNTWEYIIGQFESFNNDRKKILDFAKRINKMQQNHAKIYHVAKDKWSGTNIYTDNNVGDYQKNYSRFNEDSSNNFNNITIFPYTTGNDKRYDYPNNPKSGDSQKGGWQSESIYGQQTDDRRLLGRWEDNNDYDENTLKEKNNILKNYGLALYKADTGYYELGELKNSNQSGTQTESNSGDVYTGDQGVDSTDTPYESQSAKFNNWLKNFDVTRLGNYLLPIKQYHDLSRVNRANLKLNSEKPVYLEQPYRLEYPIHGDLATNNYYNILGSRIRTLTSQARTSDALINSMQRLAGEEKASEYDLKGYLADNEVRTKTASQHISTENDNIKRYTDVANDNIQRMLSKQASVLESIKQFNLQNINNKLGMYKDLLTLANNEKKESLAFKDQLNLKLLPDIEKDEEVKDARNNLTLTKLNYPNDKDKLKAAEENLQNTLDRVQRRIWNNYYREYARNHGYNISDILANNESSNFEYILNRKKGGRLIPKHVGGASFATKFNKVLSDIGGDIGDSASTVWSTVKNSFKGGLNGNLGQTISAGTNLLSASLGDPGEYSGVKGNITQSADQAYDTIQNAVGAIPVYGQALSAVMGVNKLASGITKKLGGGTDGMTSTDALLGSSFLQMTPLGLVNGFGGSTSHELVDQSSQIKQLYGDQAMSGFAGTQAGVNSTMQYSNKKYGLFSSNARNKANRAIDKLNQQQSQIADIAASTRNAFDAQAGMNAVNANATSFDLAGGYQQGAVHMGKTGMKFEYILEKPYDYVLEVPKFQNGGKPEIQNDDENQEQYTPTEEEIENILNIVNNSGANWVKRLQETKLNWKDPEHSISSHKLSWATGNGKVYIYPNIQELPGISKYTQGENGLHDFTNPKYKHKEWDALYSALETGDAIEVPNEKIADWFTNDNYKKYYDSIIQYAPKDEDLIKFWQKGGQMNVIPEGNLHARLHHMENVEGLTKKGIPVIDNEGNQQAEIELNEIIFNKETTTKLEKLWKEGTDEAAIEAGKILAKEIMENTEDRTGLIETIE